MVELRTTEEVDAKLLPLKDNQKTIGFVPTMGALHEGHLTLLRQAKQECDIVIVSIFINPTQFNDVNDLNAYPRQEEKDLELLESNQCDFVFLPTVDVVYPKDYVAKKIDLGFIGETMEGAHRPGHFDGVVNVVSRLFDIIQPDYAYFGNKDFQQVAVVKKMQEQYNKDVKIRTVNTKRESSGLAMSSRNMRLSPIERKKAQMIYKTLNKGKEWAEQYAPYIVLQKMIDYFSESELELEYLSIVHPDTLKPLNQYWVPNATACIAAYCNNVRLIDNMVLFPEK